MFFLPHICLSSLELATFASKYLGCEPAAKFSLWQEHISRSLAVCR